MFTRHIFCLLEQQFQPELQLPHIAALTGDTPEIGTTTIGIGVAPIHVVRGVKCLEAELQALGFGEMKLLQ